MHLQIQRPDRLHTHHHRVRRTAGTQTYCPRHDHFQRISTRREAAGKGTQGQPPRPPATRDPGPPSPYRRTSSTRPQKAGKHTTLKERPATSPRRYTCCPGACGSRADTPASLGLPARTRTYPCCSSRALPRSESLGCGQTTSVWTQKGIAYFTLFDGKRCSITMEQSFGS